jgi:hypothetical protein
MSKLAETFCTSSCSSNEVQEAAGVLRARQPHAALGNPGDFRGAGLDPAGGQGLLDGFEHFRGAGHGEGVAVRLDVVGARLHRDLDELLLLDGGLVHEEQALALEHVGHAPGVSQAAAALVEDPPDLRGRPVAVVGEHVQHHRHAARAEPFVGELLVDHAFELARALLDGPLDALLGHVDRAGLVEGVLELQVHVGVAAPRARGEDDHPGDLRERLPLLRVRGALLVLDPRPVGMP